VPDRGGELIPGDFRPGFRRAFAWWLRRFVRRRFHAVRMVRGGAEVLARAAASPGPVLLVSNHASWWDPLVGLYVHDRWFRDRPIASPIDRTQLENFRFFRKLGMFGVDPDDATGLRPFVRHVEGLLRASPRTLVMMTPQGRFVDPRLPVRIRPGAALLASRLPGMRICAVAIEYGFWTDQRPECFMRAVEVAGPDTRLAPAVADWQRAFESAMDANARALAEATSARDASAFEAICGGGEGRIHPVYDAVLRLSGRRTSIGVSHRRPEGVRP
jgi:1-acyl-sn-glycerol-3-phosphate acyltransferase